MESQFGDKLYLLVDTTPPIGWTITASVSDVTQTLPLLTPRALASAWTALSGGLPDDIADFFREERVHRERDFFRRDRSPTTGPIFRVPRRVLTCSTAHTLLPSTSLSGHATDRWHADDCFTKTFSRHVRGFPLGLRTLPAAVRNRCWKKKQGRRSRPPPARDLGYLCSRTA